MTAAIGGNPADMLSRLKNIQKINIGQKGASAGSAAFHGQTSNHGNPFAQTGVTMNNGSAMPAQFGKNTPLGKKAIQVDGGELGARLHYMS